MYNISIVYIMLYIILINVLKDKEFGGLIFFIKENGALNCSIDYFMLYSVLLSNVFLKLD